MKIIASFPSVDGPAVSAKTAPTTLVPAPSSSSPGNGLGATEFNEILGMAALRSARMRPRTGNMHGARRLECTAG
jgi:hypothetical protein